MKTRLLSLVFACISLFSTAQNISYVTQEGAGTKTGDSWENAYDCQKLQKAIKEVSEKQNGQVWVAQGVYKPDFEGLPYNTFMLQEEVKVYGGFKGTETNIDQRKRVDLDKNGIIERWEFKYPTIISGNLGDTANMEDNSNTLFTAHKLDTSSFLDGFVLRDAFSEFRIRYGYGAVSSCYIRNSVITNNRGFDIGGCGNCKLEYCLLTKNQSQITAAVASHSELDHCVIRDTEPFSGGGILDCCFVNNSILEDIEGTSMIYNSRLENCIIRNISSYHQCIVYKSVFKHCLILDNTVTNTNVIEKSEMENCIIGGNSAVKDDYAYPWLGEITDMKECTVKKCVFTDTVDMVKSQLEKCFINKPVNSINSSVNNSYFLLSDNLKFKQGKLTNCLIANNKSAFFKGTSLNSCTLVNNNSIEIEDSSDIVYVKNSILWGNSWLNSGKNAYEYSAVQDKVYAGTGNIKLDAENSKGPKFRRPSKIAGIPGGIQEKAGILLADWRLKHASPCVDAGNNDCVTTDTDLDGHERINGSSVDMGCYELGLGFRLSKSMGLNKKAGLLYPISFEVEEVEKPAELKGSEEGNTFTEKEMRQPAAFRVYPTQFASELTIAAPTTDTYSLKIFNTAGELNYQLDNQTGNKTINLNHLPQAVYQVVLTTKSGNTYQERVIKE